MPMADAARKTSHRPELVDASGWRRAGRRAVRPVGKVIIQIPCYNEAGTIGATLAALPRTLEGVGTVEWMIVDDGSDDDTVQIALAAGVDHVVSHSHNRGLARAFESGLEAALAAGADVVVNTDADNQYCAEDIPKLIAPIVEQGADLVVGTRPIEDIAHFSPLKKRLQRLGSWFVRKLSGTDVPDAPSGFRAMSRDAAQRLHVFGDYTYTLETIIQAGRNGMRIRCVDVRVNGYLRPSRLMRGMPSYIARSTVTAVRMFITYRPFRFFAVLGSAVFGLGFVLGLRFLILYATGDGDGHVQSLILMAVLLMVGAQIVIVGIVTDLIAVNRKLLQKVDWRLRTLQEDRPARP